MSLYKYALSDSNKVLDLPFVDLNAEQNFGGYNINNVLTVQSNDNYNCYKLDHFNLKNISLIKIDVENHELLTLYGMKETLIHNKPTILLEIWSKSRGWIYPEMQNDSTFCQKVLLNYIDVTHFLESLNYITYHIFGDEYLFVHKSNLKLLADFLSNL